MEAQAQRLLAALTGRLAQARLDRPVRPIPAIALARWLGVRVGGSRDSRRRGVRLLIQQLRQQGHAVVESREGYKLAQETSDVSTCARYRRSNGLQRLAAARDLVQSQAAADMTGQLALFQV